MKPFFNVFRRFMTTQDVEKLITKYKCRFDGNIRRVCVTGIGDGRCTADMEICDEHTDVKKNLHNGMTATLVDAFTTFGVSSHKNSYKLDSVSVDMYITFLQPPCLGEVVSIEADSLKVGKLAFTTCLITNKCTGALIAKAAHTKSIVQK